MKSSLIFHNYNYKSKPTTLSPTWSIVQHPFNSHVKWMFPYCIVIDLVDMNYPVQRGVIVVNFDFLSNIIKID